jgi:hypothetical protein
MKKLILLLIASLFTLNLSSYAKGNDGIVLKLNLAKGSRISSRTVAVMDMLMRPQGMEMNMKMTIKSDMEYKVIDTRSDTLIDMEFVYKDLSTETDVNGMNMTIAAKGDSSNPMSSLLASIINKPVRLTMSVYGKVYKVEGADSLKNAMVEAINNLPDNERSSMQTVADGYVSEKSIKSSIEQSFAIYGPGQVSVGKPWIKNAELNSGNMAFNTTHHFLLNGINDGKYSISDSVTLISDTSYVDNGLSRSRFKVSGTQTGRITLDPKTGLLENSDYSGSMAGEVFVNFNNSPNDMNMPITVKHSTLVVMKKID